MKKIIFLLSCFSVLFAQVNLSQLTPEQSALYKQYTEGNQNIITQSTKKKADVPVSNDLSKKNVVSKISDVPKDVETDTSDTISNPFDYKLDKNIFANIQKNKIKKIDTAKDRYGASFFLNKNRVNSSSIPTPDYYTLSNGDSLSIFIYGTEVNQYELEIDSNAKINFPGIGLIKVGGLSFADAKETIKSALSKAYPQSNIIIDISNYSAIQVLITGNVAVSGIYNLPSFSTIKDALLEAGGVSEFGTYREITLKRHNKIIEKVDLYKLLNTGEKLSFGMLRNGDTIYIPKVKKLVSISGEVSRPGVYELTDDENYKTLFDLALNMKANASKYSMKLTRYKDNNSSEVLRLNYNELISVFPKDKDVVKVYPVSSLSENMVLLNGNIVKEGEYQMPADKKLSTLFHSIIQKGELDQFFLENTLFSYAIIKRKNIGKEETILPFEISKVLAGKEEIILQSQDHIYILNNLQIKDNPFIQLNGNVLSREGKYQYFAGMKLKDILSSTKIKPDINFNNDFIKLERIVKNNKTISILKVPDDLDFKLEPLDSITFYAYNATHAKNSVNIQGEVYHPGELNINGTTTIGDVIRYAGGITQKAYLKNVEIARYSVENDRRVRNLISVDLEAKDAYNTILQNDDEVIIRTIPYWNKKRFITVSGEVKFPGTYALGGGETLYDVLKRAGGYTDYAFTKGAVFTRNKIKVQEKEELARSLKFLKDQALYLIANPSSSSETKSSTDTSLLSVVSTLEEDAKKTEPIGRLVVVLNENLDNFEKSNYNIALENGDRLVIPKISKTISVVGEVLNSQTFIFDDLSSVEDYIEKAGGLKDSASDKIYIIKADGEATNATSGFFLTSNEKLEYGDVIVVPMDIKIESNMNLARAIADITYKLAITAASLSTVGAI